MPRFFAVAVMAIVILVAGPLAVASGAAESVGGTTCAAYRDHLRSARSYLERGHREAALAELHRARQALEGCIREEATQGNLLAVRGLRTLAG
jgi:hypothetical protein